MGAASGGRSRSERGVGRDVGRVEGARVIAGDPWVLGEAGLRGARGSLRGGCDRRRSERALHPQPSRPHVVRNPGQGRRSRADRARDPARPGVGLGAEPLARRGITSTSWRRPTRHRRQLRRALDASLPQAIAWSRSTSLTSAAIASSGTMSSWHGTQRSLCEARSHSRRKSNCSRSCSQGRLPMRCFHASAEQRSSVVHPA